ncbi:MAG: diguanylate cyclase [Anaerolineae bacterium]|nr:diguanylate cyclase [Anaerolineae bacterium]
MDELFIIRYANHSAEQLLKTPQPNLTGKKFEYLPQPPQDIVNIELSDTAGTTRILLAKFLKIDACEPIVYLVTLHEITGQSDSLQVGDVFEELMQRVCDQLYQCHTTEEIARQVSGFFDQLLPQYTGALFITSAMSNTYQLATTGDNAVSAMPKELRQTDCRALQSGKLHFYSPDSPSATRCNHLPQEFCGAALCVPIGKHEELLGLLHLQSSTGIIEQHIHNTISRLSKILSIILMNIRLRELMIINSPLDATTGLFNRYLSEELLKRELHRTQRHHRPLSIMLFEIDQLVDLTLSSNNAIREFLLSSWGNYLNNQFRDDDIVCRYSDTEFIIILPETSLKDALSRAVTLQEDAKSLEIVYHGHDLTPLTLSIGIACFPKHGNSTEKLLAAAKAALQEAVNRGRNLVFLAHETGKGLP